MAGLLGGPMSGIGMIQNIMQPQALREGPRREEVDTEDGQKKTRRKKVKKRTSRFPKFGLLGQIDRNRK